jgi:hypothetical protein
VGVRGRGIDRQRTPKVVLGFAILLLLGQGKAQSDVGVAVVRIFRYRAAVTRCCVFQSIQFQMLVAVLLVGAAACGRWRGACGKE